MSVAIVTGAARGLGQAICVGLTRSGADIIATDVSDLDETVAAVEELGRRVVARETDVRDQASLDAAVKVGVAELGGLDIVVANAGISNWSRFWEMPEDQWQTMLDVNLSGVWRTFKAAAPVLIEQGRGGSMVAISSVAGLKALPGQAPRVHGPQLWEALVSETGPFRCQECGSSAGGASAGERRSGLPHVDHLIGGDKKVLAAGPQPERLRSS